MSRGITVANSCQNKNALAVLAENGFSPSDIRKSLVILNRVRLRDLTKNGQVSITSVSNTIQGRRYNDTAAKEVSKVLGLSMEDLFPERLEGRGHANA